MSAYLPRQTRVDWLKGSHTANVYRAHDAWAYDTFTFAFEKNRTSMLDFTTALESWMKYVDADPIL